MCPRDVFVRICSLEFEGLCSIFKMHKRMQFQQRKNLVSCSLHKKGLDPLNAFLKLLFFQDDPFHTTSPQSKKNFPSALTKTSKMHHLAKITSTQLCSKTSTQTRFPTFSLYEIDTPSAGNLSFWTPSSLLRTAQLFYPALSNVLGKLSQEIFNKRLPRFLESKNLLSLFQYGIRKWRT